eukprot:403336711
MQNYKQGNVTKSSGGGTNSTGSKIQAIQSATKHHALASSLCNYEKFDVPTELEIEIWRSWKEFKILLKNVTSQNERVNILQREVSQSHEKNDKIIKAIVYGILHQQSQKGVIGSTGTGLIQSAAGTQASSKQQNSPETLLAELSSITMDHYEYVINILLSLIRESYDYLKQNAVNQILWLCDNLISKAVPRLFEVFLELIRCVTPITTDKKSVNLNVQLVDIFNRNINWVIQHPQQTRFSSLIFFKFLRQIEEHIDFDELRAQEIALCLRIWEVKKDECYDIGREFMRVFVNILRIPQMKIIFEDIIQIINEKPLFYHLQGMQKQFRDEYLRYLIPLSVEEKLNHMLINIPLEAYQWYLKWFVDSLKVQYGSDSETIMVDIVRHIVVNVKQDQNIVRQYNILPKYVLIAGIINSQKHEILMSATMSAVFIDWLHFSESQMHLYEPGMMLIYKSVDKYPQLSERLIEYLFSYVHLQDETRVQEYSLSVQKVLIAFERLKLLPVTVHNQAINVTQQYGRIADLINNPRLSAGIQNKLKKLYTADQIIASQQRSVQRQLFANSSINNPYSTQQRSSTNADMESDYIQYQQFPGSGQNSGINEDYNQSMFSPPHEPVTSDTNNLEDKLSTNDLVGDQSNNSLAVISSPQYELEVDDDNQINSAMDFNRDSNSFLSGQGDQNSTFDELNLNQSENNQMAQKVDEVMYNPDHDYFDQSEDSNKPIDVVMKTQAVSSLQPTPVKQKKKLTKKVSHTSSDSDSSSNSSSSSSSSKNSKSKSLGEDQSMSGAESSSSSSYDSHSEDEEIKAAKILKSKKIEKNPQNKQKIDIKVPDHIVKKYLEAQILEKFIKHSNKANLKKLLDNFCENVIKIDKQKQSLSSSSTQSNLQNPASHIRNEFSEIAFIIYESLRESLSQQSITAQLKKWDDYTFVTLFIYLIGMNKPSTTPQLIIISQIIRAMTQFDEFFEVRLLIHLFLFQNREFKMIEHSIMIQVQSLFKSQPALSQIAQQNFWNMINSHKILEFRTDENLLKCVIYVVKSNFNRLRLENDTAKLYASTLNGFKQFLRLYFLESNNQQQEKDYIIEFKALLDFYNEFLDSQQLLPELHYALDISIDSIKSDSALNLTIQKLFEEFKGAPRLHEIISPVKGLTAYIGRCSQGQKKNGLQQQKKESERFVTIVKSDSNYEWVTQQFNKS